MSGTVRSIREEAFEGLHDLEALVRKHRLHEVLVALRDSRAYEANDRILVDWLRLVGIPTTQAEFLADAKWLSEAGLIALRSACEYQVATLTERGLEVARGQATHSGVLRRVPREEVR